MTRSEHRTEIEAAASHKQLDPDLVEAIVLVESSGNPWAFNPEPQYRYVVDCTTGQPFRKISQEEIWYLGPPTGFPTLAGDRDQEWWSQKASWGLMQVMGAVARELGCRLPYLSQLCDPRINLHFGCLLYKRLLVSRHGSIAEALEAYNGGLGSVGSARTRAYARKVLDRLEQIRGQA